MRIRSCLTLVTAAALLALACSPAQAGDHAAANDTVWPSQNDIAQTAGNGKKLLENQWAKPMALFSPNNFTLTGLTVPGTSGTLNIDVALGTLYLEGRHITIPAATTVTAAASLTNFVYAKLTRDGGNLVTGVSFEVNITGTPPADSTPIATLTAGASTITATTDLRILPTSITVLTTGTEWTVPAGIRQIYVEVIGASGGGGGGGGGGVTTGPAGSSGGSGGTTSFDTLSTTGGSGGFGGKGSSVAGGANGGVPGTGSGASINLQGSGRPGGTAGNGCGTGTFVNGPGGPGGDGGYAAKLLTVAPNTDITLAIGSAGSAGSGGVGTGGTPCTGGAGQAGLAGVIGIHY
jgi:hypothetical protein